MGISFKKSKKQGESPAAAEKRGDSISANRKIVNVIKYPLVSEKAQSAQSRNQYIFLIDISANKNLVREEVERRYGVKVLKTNIVQIKGKPKRFRNIIGTKPKIKKAILTLKSGDKIEIT